jgi:hypothetical protein
MAFKLNAKGSRRIALAFIILLALYAGSYGVLSATGGWIVSESGELRISLGEPGGGLAESDIFQWQPRYGFCQWFRWSGGRYGLRSDALGRFYAPLILFDQRFIHRTRQNSQEGFVYPLPAPPYSDYHPLKQNLFSHRENLARSGTIGRAFRFRPCDGVPRIRSTTVSVVQRIERRFPKP